MRLTCPACGACGSIEFFLMDVAARETVIAALNMPAPLGKQIMTYLGLFRPGKRALTWDRVEKLLNELLPPIKNAQLDFDGQIWAAPLEYWRDGFDEMLTNRAKLSLPLKNHNYLFRIIANKSNGAGAKREKEREDKLRHRDGFSKGATQVADLVSTPPKRSQPPKDWKDQAFKRGDYAETS